MTEGTINVKGLKYKVITPKKGRPYGEFRIKTEIHAQGYFKTGEIYDGEFHPRKKK